MSDELDRGASAHRYHRAEVRSCERQSIRNEDGTHTPFIVIRGVDARNEPVRFLMRGLPGETHDDGALGDVLRQVPSSDMVESNGVRRVVRVFGEPREGRNATYYEAREIVRLNGPGAQSVLDRRDGVVALATAARLQAAGDVDGAFRLLEDHVARVCGIPAPTVAREAELAGAHPGPDPDGVVDDGIALPGEEPEDRAMRIYRSVDRSRGRTPVPGPGGDAPAAPAPTASVTEGAVADGAGAAPESAGAAEKTGEAPEAVPAPEAEAAVAVGDALSVEAASAAPPVSMPVHEAPSEPEAVAAGSEPPRVDGMASAEVASADAVDEAKARTGMESTPDGGSPDEAAAMPRGDPAAQAPAAETERQPTAAKAAAMPGFRSRARMGVPSVTPVASQGTPAAARPVPPAVEAPAKPSAETRPAPARPTPPRQGGRPRMGGPLPPPAQAAAEPEDEPAPRGPGM